MNDVTSRPEVWFHPTSGIKDLEPDVPYAVTVTRQRPASFLEIPLRRPVKATWIHGMVLAIEDPLAPEDRLIVESGLTVLVLGRWTDPMAPNEQQTWQGYAAQQLGEVLRHNYLAERLTDFGIPREAESYLPHLNTVNSVERSLKLNYDEIDQLLRAAGF